MITNRFLKALIFCVLVFFSSIACQFVSRLFSNDPPQATSTPTPESGTEISITDGMVKIFISAGEFLMGDDNGEQNEQPAHHVYLDAYWIDQTEITNGMYLKCLDAGVCNAPGSDFYYQSENTNLPVVFVSWNDASAYCSWAERRLPTEAEWEKAARGTVGQVYPWGNESPNPNLLNFDNHFNGLSSVGSFPEGASPYGALDMAGNVWEHVSDWYDEDYYSYSPSYNPLGAEGGEYHTVRGGGFFNQDYELRVSFRNYTYAEYRSSNDFGFRCAADYIP